MKRAPGRKWTVSWDKLTLPVVEPYSIAAKEVTPAMVGALFCSVIRLPVREVEVRHGGAVVIRTVARRENEMTREQFSCHIAATMGSSAGVSHPNNAARRKAGRLLRKSLKQNP